MLPFQLQPPSTGSPHLVVHVLDDEEHWAVERGRFAVQGLEAGAVLQRAVGQAPGVALHPRRQAPRQLPTSDMVTQVAQAVPQPLLLLALHRGSIHS